MHSLTSTDTMTVFISSPGDVTRLRQAARETVEWLDRGIAGTGLSLKAWSYDVDASPGNGDGPQDVVDRQLPDYDVYVGILSDYLGKGTQHELADAQYRVASGRPVSVLLYVRHPYDAKKAEFNDWIKGYRGLFAGFDDETDLMRSLTRDLLREVMKRTVAVPDSCDLWSEFAWELNIVAVLEEAPSQFDGRRCSERIAHSWELLRSLLPRSLQIDNLNLEILKAALYIRCASNNKSNTDWSKLLFDLFPKSVVTGVQRIDNIACGLRHGNAIEASRKVREAPQETLVAALLEITTLLGLHEWRQLASAFSSNSELTVGPSAHLEFSTEVSATGLFRFVLEIPDQSQIVVRDFIGLLANELFDKLRPVLSSHGLAIVRGGTQVRIEPSAPFLEPEDLSRLSSISLGMRYELSLHLHLGAQKQMSHLPWHDMGLHVLPGTKLSGPVPFRLNPGCSYILELSTLDSSKRDESNLLTLDLDAADSHIINISDTNEYILATDSWRSGTWCRWRLLRDDGFCKPDLVGAGEFLTSGQRERRLWDASVNSPHGARAELALALGDSNSAAAEMWEEFRDGHASDEHLLCLRWVIDNAIEWHKAQHDQTHHENLLVDLHTLVTTVLSERRRR